MWPSPSLCRVAPDSPTQPIAATLHSPPRCRSPPARLAPRFTPYSTAHVTIWGKHRLKLPLRTPRRARTPHLQLEPAGLQQGSSTLEQSPHAPAAANAAPSPAAAQSRFTFLSDTQRQLCDCPYAKGSSVAQFPSIILKKSFADSKSTRYASISDASCAATCFRHSRETPLRQGSRTSAANRLK